MSVSHRSKKARRQVSDRDISAVEATEYRSHKISRRAGASVHRAVMNEVAVTRRQIGTLEAFSGNPRAHSDEQIGQIAASIERFGFVNPILVDRDGKIIAGHGRLEAAKRLGWTHVPVLRIENLNDAEKRAYALADNRLAEKAGWDPDLLALEFEYLGKLDLNFDLTITGFDTGEIDLLLDPKREQATENAADNIPTLDAKQSTISRQGDLWQLGAHRLVCGDTLQRQTFHDLMGDGVARIIFTDPPYNVRIPGNVTRSTRARHADFVMASGEMTEPQFIDFLETALKNHSAFAVDGSIHFVCIDWRHIYDLLIAGRSVYTEIKNICVWNKDRAGMGTFYRSKHELICVFKNGHDRHINNFELGQHGRYRTNVWDYAGPGSTTAGGNAERDDHPTVKPVALVADAIKDCSKRGDIVLDGFAGSGTTIIAAEKTGRMARAIELDPLYVDVAVKRWETFTGKSARHAKTGRTFSETTKHRSAQEQASAVPPARGRVRHDQAI